MNTNIPMGFQPTNVLAMMDAGTQAGARMGEVQQRGRLLNAYREHGAGVLSGDPNAMNALAAIDLPQAMDFRGQNQAYRINEETMALRRQSARQQAAQAAAQMSQEEAAAAAAGIGRALAPAITALRAGDLATVQQIAAAAGIPEEAIPQTLEEAEYLIASYEEALPVFESAQAVAGVQAPAQPDYVTINGQLVDRNAQGGPSVVDVQGMPEQEAGFRVATPEEAAQYGAPAGQIGPDGRFYPINPPPGMSIESDGQGGFRLTQGPGAGQEDPNGFSRVDPASPSSMVNSIDGILNDPALDFATGWLEWTQRLPGGPTTRFGTRAAQLDGQAFLQAYNSLRGGGQITEAEGSRALAAIGRLDTAQSAQDYREALIELRNIIVTGTARPQGWVTSQDSDGGVGVPFEPGGGIPTISSPQEAQSLPPGTVFYDPQGNLREVPRQ
jgi:hypothetical protein